MAELVAVDSGVSAPTTQARVTEMRRAWRGAKAMRRVGRLLPLSLGAYALFDRGFAYLHLPGLPVFTGEVLLAVGLVVVVVATPAVRRAVWRSSPAAILLCFALWGLIRTLPFVGRFGFDAIRDAALWYYSLFALVVGALVIARPQLPEEWARRYDRFLPWLLVWSPLAIVVRQRFPNLVVPDSDVPVFSHKPGNIAVQTALVLAFLWLVPEQRERQNRRLLLTMLATVVLATTATQNRGGLVAAGVALAIAWLLSRYSLSLVLSGVGTVAFVLLFAWSIDFKVTADRREISVGQLIQNIVSLSGEESSELGATVQWRQDLWKSVLDLTRREQKLFAGWGFGTNLAEQLGFQGDAALPLRSPHNSHLDVLARMGLVGAGLWVALWWSWFRFIRRARRRLQGLRRGLIEVCMVGVVAMLVGAYFDPTLESPQAALWLWTLFGLGLGLVGHERRSHDPAFNHSAVPARLAVGGG